LLTLYAAPNDCGHARLGVSVGKSFGGAVVRNRLKRLLREVFRQNQQQIPAGFDYVVMISNRRIKSYKVAGQLTFQQVRASFLALAKTEDGTQKSDFGLPTSDI
jgi:ribonuclease P protein component